MKYNKPLRPTQIIAQNLIKQSIQKICMNIYFAPSLLRILEDEQRSNVSQHKSMVIKKQRIPSGKQSRSIIRKERCMYLKQQTPERKQSASNQSNSITNLSNFQPRNIKSYSRVVQKQINKQLSQRAEQFVVMLRERKKQLDGKIYLLKRAQLVRKRDKQRKIEVESQVEKEIQKKIRKINAQKNIQYYNQKKKLFSRQESHSKSRSYSVPNTIQQQYSKLKLPSIYNTQLEQIKQQGFQSRVPDGLKKTVIKKNRRSLTQADHRQYDGQQESRQIKLMSHHRQKPLSDNRNQYKQYLRARQESLNDGKKCYLISKNLTEDIGDYLQKYNNLNDLMDLKNKVKNKGFKKQQKLLIEKKMKKKLKPKSRAHYNQFEANQLEQNVSEDQTIQYK